MKSVRLVIVLCLTGAALLGAEFRADIEYGAAGGERLRLDASVPEGDGPFPVAILIHGGGWGSGDKAGPPEGGGADITPWFSLLNEGRFTWFSINYRLAPAHRWPACFEDVQTAIRWVKEHAREFKGDPTRIVLFGHSAGGHLATLAGTLDDPALRVQAVVGFAPVTDFEFELPARGGLGLALQNLHGQPKEVNPASLAILRDTAAINRVRPGLPPFLLLHGDADRTVPYQTSLNFRDKLIAAGGVCDLITIPGGPHRLTSWLEHRPGYPQEVRDWLARHLAPAAREPAVIPLWPEGVPGLRADASPEKVSEGPRFTNIHHPTLLVYRPQRTASNGTAMIYAPGGGYQRVAVGGPDGGEARWLNDLGVTVFVLKYRHAEYGHPAPLQDVLRAIRLVRSRADEFGVRADRIGVIGGSAGGHLAACAATMWDDPAARTGAALDAVGARPDFAVLVYPVVSMADPIAHRGSREALLGKNPAPALVERLSVEKRVRPDMPPVFIAATMADKSVPVENSLLLYQALRQAGVPAEMHLYAQGSHGNSHDPQYGPTALWPQRVVEWMRFNGWLPALSQP